ncbi:hypothetical protein HMPREF0724_12536 [Prescottella equi ATCC 33707]|uniref:Uncharacterized protein n=1 Tax=Prescottella equi ATCC 33707 TaxID=525370 RepID=E9T1V9_RHOHA|nr:hypothetical protein HMPREF0724_12536 [Prescottella equi ATCC 33707]
MITRRTTGLRGLRGLRFIAFFLCWWTCPTKIGRITHGDGSRGLRSDARTPSLGPRSGRPGRAV